MLTALALLAVGLSPGTDVLERHECFRCHVYVTQAQHSDDLRCAECHRRLSAGLMDEKVNQYTPAVWERFKRRTAEHFTRMPPLIGLGRLRASWLQRFLAAPYDLRPHLSESMIRNRLTRADVKALSELWGAQRDERPPPSPSAERLATAKKVFDEQGCTGCHGVTKPAALPQYLAPDLRHTRDRMNFSAVVDYVTDSHRVNPASEMPTVPRPPETVQLLAEHVYFGDHGVTQVRAAPVPPPYDAKAPVPKYEEVEARVFKAVCWHCHSNPDFANGNGGPGMSGGFGYPERGLSFASFDEVMNGSLDAHGRRQSIFRKGQSGEPVLLEVMRARWSEEAGGLHGALVGMPLGLPGVSAEDYALVERWVKGGRPRPRGEPVADGLTTPNRVEKSVKKKWPTGE
ncbi:MAG: c-type cytochrome [Myxococcaceae bacterium]|nr:c-type cytochrome [Myxococcaceae bacterium]